MFKDSLRALRKEFSMTQDELAKRLQLAKSTISMYENGNREPDMETLDKLAEIFRVDMNSLLDRQLPANIYPAESNIILIPKYGEVAAGTGCLAENQIVGYEPFSASSIKKGQHYICLEVKGDSMYPTLIEGDTVLIKQQNTVDNGAFAVLTVNGDEGVIKKVKYGKDWIELHSINPMYPVRRFEGEDVLKINIIGLVVESKRKF